ncbi:MAG TPA: hypothetical protein VGN31_13420, partial [Paraburkholderia sp.]
LGLVVYVPDGHDANDAHDARNAGRTIDEPVLTTQVAPTILRVLGLEPELLHSVALEGTPVLPQFDHGRF